MLYVDEKCTVRFEIAPFLVETFRVYCLQLTEDAEDACAPTVALPNPAGTSS